MFLISYVTSYVVELMLTGLFSDTIFVFVQYKYCCINLYLICYIVTQIQNIWLHLIVRCPCYSVIVHLSVEGNILF